jgi:hypothetical protein
LAGINTAEYLGSFNTNLISFVGMLKFSPQKWWLMTSIDFLLKVLMWFRKECAMQTLWCRVLVHGGILFLLSIYLSITQHEETKQQLVPLKS